MRWFMSRIRVSKPKGLIRVNTNTNQRGATRRDEKRNNLYSLHFHLYLLLVNGSERTYPPLEELMSRPTGSEVDELTSTT